MTALQAEAIRPKQPTEFRLLQASGEFDFAFDDLGIEIEGDFLAGSFTGVAKVTYWNDSDGLTWDVGNILLRTSRWNGTDYDVQFATLEFGDRLYIPIWSELTERSAWKDSIDARVREQL